MGPLFCIIHASNKSYYLSHTLQNTGSFVLAMGHPKWRAVSCTQSAAATTQFTLMAVELYGRASHSREGFPSHAEIASIEISKICSVSA